MQKLMLTLALVAMTSIAGAQESRTELVKPSATPLDDSKPNSDKIPAAYAISGQFDRVMILRLKYQTDLLTTLEAFVKQQKIRNAVILAGIGSVRGYHVHSVSNRVFPSRDIYVKNPTAPADIVSMNGYVVDGRVHAHIMLADADKAFGGHLEPGTEVFTFAAVTIGILNDKADLNHLDDKTYR
jgi:predicted DNA-binding protein with PD1-like motif